MAANYFDAVGILRETCRWLEVLPEELIAINKRLAALAVRSRPPDWGYAGMLATLEESGDIVDVYDVYATVKEWRDKPELANAQFEKWNSHRLAKS